MDPKLPSKEKTLSLLYGGVPASSTKKIKAGSSGKPRSKVNPSIELIDPSDVPLSQLLKHPPPPRRLPLGYFKKPRTVRKASNASPSESVEEEMDVVEEEDEPIDKDADEELYSPNDEDEDNDNSFDHNDTMSEDGVLGEGDEVEQEPLHISSGEDKGSAKSKKKRKQAKECIENSSAWDHFEKVMVQ